MRKLLNGHFEIDGNGDVVSYDGRESDSPWSYGCVSWPEPDTSWNGLIKQAAERRVARVVFAAREAAMASEGLS